jgi:DNA-binding MarR family transcriptional regulator
MTKLDNDALGFVIHDVARMLRWEFDRRAQTFNLTRSQWSVLVALIRENGVQQRTLADIADVTAITMTGLLDRLERDGWVVRKPDPEDRRAKRVYLTDKIDPVMADIKAIVKEVRATALHGLSAQERDQLISLMLRIRQNLSSQDSHKNI